MALKMSIEIGENTLWISDHHNDVELFVGTHDKERVNIDLTGSPLGDGNIDINLDREFVEPLVEALQKWLKANEDAKETV